MGVVCHSETPSLERFLNEQAQKDAGVKKCGLTKSAAPPRQRNILI